MLYPKDRDRIAEFVESTRKKEIYDRQDLILFARLLIKQNA
jgi:hypothetical protein